jgi:hypothetical protein
MKPELENTKGPEAKKLQALLKVAGSTRLELAASGVTGRRSNQLNYDPAVVLYLVGGTGLEPVTPGL